MTAGSPTLFDTRGATLQNEGSATLFDIRNAELINTGSATAYDTGENPVLSHIRGPQFRDTTIDGADRFVKPIGPALLSTTSDINFLSTGNTTVYTVTAGKTAIIQGIVIRATAGTAVSTDASASLGISPSTTDLFAVEPLTQFRIPNDVFVFWSSTSISLVATTGQDILLRVTTAATGTVLVGEAYLFGFEI